MDAAISLPRAQPPQRLLLASPSGVPQPGLNAQTEPVEGCASGHGTAC